MYYTAELRLTQIRRHLCERASRQLDSSTARAQVRAQVQSEPIFNNWRFTIDIPLKIKRKWVKHIAELYRIPVEFGHGHPRRLVLGDKPTIIRSDNASSVRVANDPKSAGRLRHAMRRFAVLQEGVKEGKVKIVFVPEAEGALLAGQERE